MIRPATPDDIDAMAAVWDRSQSLAYSGIFPADAPKPTTQDLVAALGDTPGFVAIDGAQIVGLVQAHAGWFSHLYVDPDHWGRGIGAALHTVALDALRKGGHAEANLWVLRKNTRARAMYEKWGWAPTGTSQGVYAPARIDEVGYALALR